MMAGLAALAPLARAADSVVFIIQPNELSIDPGQGFEVTISIASGGAQIPVGSAGTIHLDYNSSLFQVSSVDPGANWNAAMSNATTLSFSTLAAVPNSTQVATVHFTTLTSQAFTGSRIQINSPAMRTATGAPLPAAPSEAQMNLYVSTKSAEAGFPWWALIPVIVVVAAIPPAVYLLRRRKPAVPSQPTQPQKKDKDDKDRKQPDHTAEVLRKEDLVSLKFEFYNFRLEKALPPAKLVRISPTEPAYMSVTFQGQNVNERAYFEVNKNVGLPAGDKDAGTGDTDAPKAPPVPAILAYPSRLVFRIPHNVQLIQYSMRDLLAWADYDLSVVPVALPDSPLEIDLVQATAIREPGEKETAIEVPYRLVISPSQLGGWAHARDAVEHEGWTELWHTRLGVRRRDGSRWVVDEKDATERIVRGVWTPDYSPPPSTNNKGAFRASLTPRDRYEIVRLSSDNSIKGDSEFQLAGQLHASSGTGKSGQAPAKKMEMPARVMKPIDAPSAAEPSSKPEAAAQLNQGALAKAKGRPPVRVNRLMLSTLGAWIDARGSWDPPAGLSVMEWAHRGTQGRDNYVKVVYKGYLFPLGHRASLVKVTERKFLRAQGAWQKSGHFIAYLRQRMYIVVLEHEKGYGAEGRNNAGRDWPFGKVRVITEVTPSIDIPEQSGVGGLGIKAFWPKVNGQDFHFRVQAEDLEGFRTEFDAPLVFVMNEIAHDPDALGEVYNSYPQEEDRRKVDMLGQRVSYARSAKPGDTMLETDAIHLNVERPDAPPPSIQPYFYPTIDRFDVNVPSLTAILGRRAGVGLSYDQTYLGSGWDQAQNKGEVFAALVQGSQLKTDFPSYRAGGLVNPNLSVAGLSRSLGPVGGDIGPVKQGAFDPTAYFKDALSEAKMLGIPLLDVMGSAGLDRTPVMTMEETPALTKVVLDWTPQLKSSGNGVFVDSIDRDGAVEQASMNVKVTIVKPKDGSQATVDVVGWLRSFEIRLIPAIETFLAVKFDKVSFESHAGQKLVFDAELFRVDFAGPLSFVNELQKFIPLNGFDPPGLEVTPQGVKASYVLGIPTIGFGVFTLANISLGASLNLPFTGDPVRLRFSFCERHSPFLLSVSIYGGGGFFAVALGPDRIEIIEGSLEFGGSVSIDIGVASGAVYVMAGVYFKLESTPQGERLQLTGYLRCGGALEVLGLISISCEFYLGLNYQPSPKRLWGEATLTVEVSVAFFSKSVDLTVQREFASSPPPSFEDVVPELKDWTDYCEAFA